MNQNTRYMARLWIAVGLFVAMVVFLMVRGNPLNAIISLSVAAAICIVVRIAAKRLVGEGNISRLLQSPTPDALINMFMRTIRPTQGHGAAIMPAADALLASSCAIAYILYGDFAEARATIEAINWGRRPPTAER